MIPPVHLPEDGSAPENESEPTQRLAVGWTDSPLLASEHINRLVAGGASEGHWLLDLFSQFPIPRLGSGLSLNCGAGDLEFLALRRGLLFRVDGFDASPGAVRLARDSAARDRFECARFEVAEAEAAPLAPGTYDFVLSQFAFHRLASPGPFFDRLAQALRPGAWLVLNEYVGPRYFQFSTRALELVEEICARLPERLLRRPASGEVKRTHVPLPLAHYQMHDVRDGASSERVLPELEARFDLVARRDYGGTLLNPLLEGIIANFREELEEDKTILRLLALLERLLLEQGGLPSDFAVLVARARER